MKQVGIKAGSEREEVIDVQSGEPKEEEMTGELKE